MQIRLALEKGQEGGALCWGLDYPGCFSFGTDDAEALLKFPQVLLNYEAWIRLHAEIPWFQLGDLDFRVVESFACHVVEHEGKPCEVNAFFNDDLRPLQALEITQAMLVFDWQREELLAGIETLPTEFLDRMFPGQRWSINGILEHISSTERYYLKCLGDKTSSHTQTEPLELLDYSASLIHQCLPMFAGSDLCTTFGCEEWTPRKFVRRILSHQRDHIGDIRQLIDQYLQG